MASCISAVVNIVLNLFLIPEYSYNAAAFTTLVSELLMFIIGIYCTHRTVKIEIWKYLILSIIGGIEVWSICCGVKAAVVQKISALFVSVIMCGVVYGATIVVMFLLRKKARPRRY